MLETTANPVYYASFAYVDLMTPTVVTLMGVWPLFHFGTKAGAILNMSMKFGGAAPIINGDMVLWLSIWLHREFTGATLDPLWGFGVGSLKGQYSGISQLLKLYMWYGRDPQDLLFPTIPLSAIITPCIRDSEICPFSSIGRSPNGTTIRRSLLGYSPVCLVAPPINLDLFSILSSPNCTMLDIWYYTCVYYSRQRAL